MVLRDSQNLDHFPVQSKPLCRPHRCPADTNETIRNFHQTLLSDIDECLTTANDCRYACKNLIGSFMCICPQGYVQIGTGDQCRGKVFYLCGLAHARLIIKLGPNMCRISLTNYLNATNHSIKYGHKYSLRHWVKTCCYRCWWMS